MKRYVYNKLETNLVLKAGYINIPAKSWIEASEHDLASGVYQAAIDMNYVEIKDMESAPANTPAAPVKTIDVIQPTQGLTAEQLKEELAKKTEEPSGTVSEIGKPAEGVNVEGSTEPPKVQTPVETPVVEAPAAEVVAEPAPTKKRGKKAEVEASTEPAAGQDAA